MGRAASAGSCRPTRCCTCTLNVRGCRSVGWRSACTTCRTWCWRWTTRPMFGCGSWGSTRSGDSPRSGCWCRGRSRSGTRGLTIHVRGADGGYRVVTQSEAFPGWKAEEIHAALTEEPLSAETHGVLERVGRAMGAREGTRPEDDPLARSLSARAREEGTCEHGARDSPCPGHRGRHGPRGGPSAPRWSPGRGADGRGAGVHRCDGLPAATARGVAGWRSGGRQAGRTSAMTSPVTNAPFTASDPRGGEVRRPVRHRHRPHPHKHRRHRGRAFASSSGCSAARSRSSPRSPGGCSSSRYPKTTCRTQEAPHLHGLDGQAHIHQPRRALQGRTVRPVGLGTASACNGWKMPGDD